jgi:hypothetical protein
MTQATQVETSEPIDLSDWGFDIELDKLIGNAVTEAIKTTFKESPPYIYLPFYWGKKGDGYNGPSVDDPLEIRIGLPFANISDGFDNVFWKFSLMELLTDEFEMEVNDIKAGDKAERQSTLPKLRAISARLREIANTVDGWIK